MLLKKSAVYLMISVFLSNPLLGGLLIYQQNNEINQGLEKKVVNSKSVSSIPIPRITSSNGIVSPVTSAVSYSNQKQTVENYGTNGGTQASAKAYQDQVAVLARIIYAEAWGEPFVGQVAVGAVLLNRVESGRFPRTLAGNIFKQGEFESVSNGYIWAIQPSAESYKAARLALSGWDPTYGSLYFFNPAKSSSSWIWSRPIALKIGNHYFAH